MQKYRHRSGGSATAS
uniref:Uncharacterized protein n=1 Tax=Anguilla anguilla TaxID=7936 RepID=A0A0E9UAV2_ANGAN